MVKKVKVLLNIDIVVKENKIPVKLPDGTWTTQIQQITNPGPNQEYSFLKNEYLSLVSQYKEPGQLEDFVGGMPLQLEKSCIKQLLRRKDNQFVYYVTLKVDGERYLMFLSSNGTIYFIDRGVNFYYFVNDDNTPLMKINMRPFMFDGEMVYHKKNGVFEFLIFDVLFYQGESVMSKDYYTRYDIANYALKNVLNEYFKMINSNLTCSLKTWFPLNNTYNNIAKKTNNGRSKMYELVSDGLILQPFDTEYVPFGPWNKYNNVLFKWKPSDQLTIDFKIKVIGPSEWHLLTKTDEVFNVNQTKGNPLPATCIPTESQKEKFFDGQVVEFKYRETMNKYGNLFVPLRSRSEKDANSYNTIMTTLNVIHNPFTLDILKPAFKVFESNRLTKEYLELFSESDLILTIMKDSQFFNEYEKTQIKKVYTEVSDNVELEFRLFKFGKSGKTLDKFTFFYVNNFLIRNFKYTIENTVDMTENKPTETRKFRTTYKLLTDVPKESFRDTTSRFKCEYKEKIINYSMEPKVKNLYNNLTFKLEASKEIPTDRVIGLKSLFAGKMVNNYIRVKNRYSFDIHPLWRLDLTQVLSAYTPEDLEDKNESFELECEFIGKDVPFDTFIESFSNVYKILLSNSGYC